jgi:radical SAM/Cys-rich protein
MDRDRGHSFGMDPHVASRGLYFSPLLFDHQMNEFDQTLQTHGLKLRRGNTEIVQMNVGKLCNLTCNHCHVNAGPHRKEIMTRETLDRILSWLEATDILKVDLTGGAPEMIPDFRYLVERLSSMKPRRQVMDRCNLTILLEPGHESLANFFAAHHVEIIASLPCYLEENVDAQRGNQVFQSSIRALQLLNDLGYGRDPSLALHLVYNPMGDDLPPPQEELERDYKRELKVRYNIDFDRLYSITNMPIARFASSLRRSGKLQSYMDTLVRSFNSRTVEGLMCRNTLSVGWQGEVYDCDFNQQLGLQWRNGKALYLWDIDPQKLNAREITTGEHCFGCTAGCGSSCGGALLAASRTLVKFSE